LAKRYPFLAIDESLAFLADKYVPNASTFIKDLSKEFNMPIVMVTHNPLFTKSSDQTYIASAAGKRLVAFTRHEGPYNPPRVLDAD
jgi:ABC-type thiamine transport system ATPase subunit